MKENYFSQKMLTKSESELRYYLDNKEKFQDEAVLAVQWELEKRGLIEPQVDTKKDNIFRNDKVVEVSEQGRQEDEAVKNHIGDDLNESQSHDGFPPKPSEEANKQSINRSLFSMVLFIGAFYLIFGWEFKYILVLTVVILIHELGHYLAMKIYKYKDLSIFFVPLVGAFASGSKEEVYQKQSVIILLSGPLPGIIMGLVLYYYGLSNESEFLMRTSNIFILINLFNLLPIMPLDGGRMIKTMFFENNEIINKIFLILSIAVLTYFSFYFQTYFLLIVPFFLLLQLNAQSQLKSVREEVINKGIKLNKSYSELTNEEYWLIRDAIGMHMKFYSKSIKPYKYVIADNENSIMKHVKAILQKSPIKDLGIGGKVLITSLWLLTFVVPLIVIAIYYIRLGIEIQ